jgi:hypothetical protein
MNFICGPCQDGDHDACRGGTQCDCQHKSRMQGLLDVLHGAAADIKAGRKTIAER